MAGLCAPLSMLRQYPHGYWRMTRGRCGSLLLHCDGLAPSTPCRSPGALRFTLRPTSGRRLDVLPNGARGRLSLQRRGAASCDVSRSAFLGSQRTSRFDPTSTKGTEPKNVSRLGECLLDKNFHETRRWFHFGGIGSSKRRFQFAAIRQAARL